MDSLTEPQIPRFVKNVIRCVLTECTDQLDILRSVKSRIESGLPVRPVVYRNLEDRYMGQEDHADCRIDAVSDEFEKFSRDVATLQAVLKETCNGNTTVLQQFVSAIRRMHHEEGRLLQDEQVCVQIVEELEKRYERERLDNLRTIEETEAKIQKLKFDVEDVNLYGGQEVDYFRKWEKTRLEQNELKCKEKENRANAEITEMNSKISLENKCHDALVKFLNESRDDYLEDIQYWMKRYDEETEQLEGDMIHLRTDLERVTGDRIRLQRDYAKRSIEINDWLEYKKAKREKEVQTMKETAAALKIQAWWRGVMVKSKLGPYRTKQKKKGKKDTKKHKNI